MVGNEYYDPNILFITHHSLRRTLLRSDHKSANKNLHHFAPLRLCVK